MGAQDSELWVVRHGETEWSRDGKHTSVTDLDLTPQGTDVARGLAGAGNLRVGFAVPMVLVLGILPLARAFAPVSR